MSSVPLRVAYFGLPLGALALHRAGVTPRVVALGHPDAPGARRARKAFSRESLLLARPDLTDPVVLRALASTQPDVILSWFWPKLIPEPVLRLAPRGAFGVHPSLLPRWRGPDPYFWALFRGDPYTGVTLHALACEYDTGDLVAQARVAVEPRDNAWTLAKRLDAPGLGLLVEAALQLARGEPLAGVAQDASEVTEAPAPEEATLGLRWQGAAEDLANQVRALSPHPGASTSFGDEPVEVLSASAYPGKLPRVLEAGDAVLTALGVVIRCGQGALLLERVRRESGELLRGREVAELFHKGLFELPG